ncbi:MAG: FUN14 domain-containing protein [Nitrososphaeraceae archaeon]
MNIFDISTSITPLLGTVGFGGIAGFLVGFALKKIMKILVIIAGVFFAAVMFLQSQGLLNINWDKLQTVSEPMISILTNNVTSTTGGIGLQTIQPINSSLSFLPAAITANMGLPLTGSAAMGFAIGMMKG